MFSRSPAAVLAGLSDSSNTSAGTDITIPTTVSSTTTSLASSTESLSVQLAMLQERLAKLESAKKSAPQTRIVVIPAAPVPESFPAPDSPVQEPVVSIPMTLEPTPTPAAPTLVPVVVIPPPPFTTLPQTPLPAPILPSTTPALASTPTPPPAPTPPPVPAGPKDGTYTGSVAQAGSRGPVQVQVVIAGGKITNISFLSSPTASPVSVSIFDTASPTLVQEAIAAQSANVTTVSGATLTSNAFKQSLASALAQA